MSRKLSNKQLRNHVAKINAQDKDRVIALWNRFTREKGNIEKQIREYRVRLTFTNNEIRDAEDSRYNSQMFYPEGAGTFIQVLEQHPVFQEERSLDVGRPIFGNNNAYNFPFLGKEASELLYAGVLAIGFQGLEDQRYIGALTHIAFNVDAISTLLRTVLDGRPIPDIGELFHIPEDLMNIYRHTCVLGIEHALNDLGRALSSNKAGNWKTGNITGLNPSSGCAGTQVVIQGSDFGNIKPARVDVLFPSNDGNCTTAYAPLTLPPTPSWSENEIVVIAPANVGSGCVGFVELPANPVPIAEPANTLAGEMEQCLGIGAFSAANRIRQLQTSMPYIPCPPCLANRANFFLGGPPEIEYFSINGGNDITVEPNTDLVLRWMVKNATQVRVYKTSRYGPAIDISNVLSSIINLGPFTETDTVDASFELIALNACEVIYRTIKARLRAYPNLGIGAGIEVVQTIQRSGNSVRLVAGKRTMVRIFVDSGITNGFNNGAGPNLQPNVTGQVTIFPRGSNWGFDAGLPVNPGNVLDAQPFANFNRNLATHSLNFELPFDQLFGTVDIQARVWVTGHENDNGGPWKANSRTTVYFENQPNQEVLPILIADPLLGLAAPTLAQYNTALQGARTRYPIAENGFIINPSIMFTTLGAGIGPYPLTSVLGWQVLLLDLSTMIFLFPTTPVGGIRTALVPNDGRYADLNGLGAPRILVSVPAFISRAPTATGNGLEPLASTFAHEMGHAFGIFHALCPPPCPSSVNPADAIPPDLLDPRLPPATEDVGVDVPSRFIIRMGQGELMSYCGDRSRCAGGVPIGPPRWPSIVFYDIISNSLPI
jgi:hypothetical protein